MNKAAAKHKDDKSSSNKNVINSLGHSKFQLKNIINTKGSCHVELDDNWSKYNNASQKGASDWAVSPAVSYVGGTDPSC